MRRGEGWHRSKKKIPMIGRASDVIFALGVKNIDRWVSAGVVIRISNNRYDVWGSVNNFKNAPSRRTQGWDGRKFRKDNRLRAAINRRSFFFQSSIIEKHNKLLTCPRCGKVSKQTYWPRGRQGHINLTCCKAKDLQYNRRLKAHGLKKCWSCGEIKHLGDFLPHATRGGENGTCRDCHKASAARKSHRERRQKWMNETDDGTLTKEAIRALFGSTQYCPVCNVKMRRNQKQLDHKTPLSRGGSHSVSNVWVICSYCNNEKGAKTLGEWMEYREAKYQHDGYTARRDSRAGGDLSNIRDF